MEPRVFSTRVTRMLGIEHPIIQGGMMWVSQPELVAAISNAGALGILTALTFETSEGLERAIAATRALTDRPFGVNLTFLPTLVPKDYGTLIDVMVGEGIPIIETAGRNPEPFLERIKAGGALVIHNCTAVRFARKAQSIGCDMVSIDGCECAGHPGEDDVSSLVLIPLTIDAVAIPVIASGGFADARGLVAALALGAEAMNMGTRFVATQEAPVHPNITWHQGRHRRPCRDRADLRRGPQGRRGRDPDPPCRSVRLHGRGAPMVEAIPSLFSFA